MSLPFDHHNEFSERIPLPEIVGGAAFVPDTGRIYRLFGNGEDMFPLPEIPALPPLCAAWEKPAVSLEEALQQIDAFFSSPIPPPEDGGSPESAAEKGESLLKPLQGDAPTLQLLQVLGESAPAALAKRAETLSNTTLPAKEMIREVLQTSPAPEKATPKETPKPKGTSPSKNTKRKPLRVISEVAEEPFIVPFIKPEHAEIEIPLSPKPEETEAETPALKIVPEVAETEIAERVQPVVVKTLISKTFRKHWLRRCKEKKQYRKPCLPPPVRMPQTKELPAIPLSKPGMDTSSFCWSQQLSSLMQTANNQIRMLTDHLVVQSNQGIKAICFKGVFPGDGCSTILLCAAKALTERGYRVLLVDAHHRHLDLPKQFNLSGNPDSENKVLTLDKHLGLWVWQELKTLEENRTLLAEAITTHRDQYDLVLLDDGSVTESPLAEFVEFWESVELDGVILISNTKRPTALPLSHIAERFRQHHIPLIGIAENYV